MLHYHTLCTIVTIASISLYEYTLMTTTDYNRYTAVLYILYCTMRFIACIIIIIIKVLIDSLIDLFLIEYRHIIKEWHGVGIHICHHLLIYLISIIMYCDYISITRILTNDIYKFVAFHLIRDLHNMHKVSS